MKVFTRGPQKQSLGICIGFSWPCFDIHPISSSILATIYILIKCPILWNICMSRDMFTCLLIINHDIWWVYTHTTHGTWLDFLCNHRFWRQNCEHISYQKSYPYHPTGPFYNTSQQYLQCKEALIIRYLLQVSASNQYVIKWRVWVVECNE